MKNENDKSPFRLNNGKKRKRYLVTATIDGTTREWASALHCSEALDFNVRELYKTVNSFLALGTKYNERGLVRRHFEVAGYKLFITIHNQEYDIRRD